MSFTVKEAATELGISATLVYALIRSRKIRHERHGLGRGTIRISETALNEYRQSREFGAMEEPQPVVLSQTSSPKGTTAFKNLDSDRLLEGWKEKDALPR